MTKLLSDSLPLNRENINLNNAKAATEKECPMTNDSQYTNNSDSVKKHFDDMVNGDTVRVSFAMPSGSIASASVHKNADMDEVRKSMEKISAETERKRNRPESEKIEEDFNEYYFEHHILLRKISNIRTLKGKDLEMAVLKLPTEKFNTPWSDLARSFEETRWLLRTVRRFSQLLASDTPTRQSLPKGGE